MTTPEHGWGNAPQPGQNAPTTQPPGSPAAPGGPASSGPAAPGSPTAPGQAGAPNGPADGARKMPDWSALMATAMANKPAVIGGGVAFAVVVIGMAFFFGGGTSQKGASTTQQLTANAPSANVQQAIVPDGFTPPKPDATGRIIDTETLTVDREQSEVTIAKVDPSTYANIGGWWARANDQGVLYLPPGKGLADVTFFSGDDKNVPYAGQAAEEKGTVTSLTFEKGVSGGYSLSPGAQVWYTDPTFQSDPAYILIPKGLEGSFQIFVGTLPVELALP